MGLFSDISNSLPSLATNAGSQALLGQAKKYLPASLGNNLGSATNIVGSLASGDLSAAASALIDSGLINKLSGKTAQGLTMAKFLATPNSLLGGLTPLMIKQMYQLGSSTKYAKKNIFLVQIAPIRRANGEALSPNEMEGSLNFFCTELSYTAYSVSGQKHQIGSAHVDTVSSSDPTEVRMTCLDDESGIVKRFFRSRAGRAAKPDGTVGLPIEYVCSFRVLHAFMASDTNNGGYEDNMWVRLGSMEFDLSRRDDQMQEIQITLVEHDTFFPV